MTCFLQGNGPVEIKTARTQAFGQSALFGQEKIPVRIRTWVPPCLEFNGTIAFNHFVGECRELLRMGMSASPGLWR